MEPTIEEIVIELHKQQIPVNYHEEAVSIIQNYMNKKECSLNEAAKFVAKWVGINEM
jgi:hypothetical protein